MKIFGNSKGWTAKPGEEKKEAPKAIRTHNLIIVDESGSMCSIYRQALDGMNEPLQTSPRRHGACHQRPPRPA